MKLKNMTKKLTIILIIVYIFGLTPINFSQAITQNQINAEVQIVCTDGADNWFSGSGTIIDPKGIILTNRHVVEGAYKNICFIGFLESINQEPNFGSKGDPNLAEVKYITTTNDMDAAVLYLENKNNTSYPYVNIWDANSSGLKFGDKIEVVGYPGIGGSTITYTSGDFSGFGSKSDGTQNYIKTTALLEHGNSGGSAYNQKGEFVGIPSMVVTGSLNSISYVLSVDSIKKWLSGNLGQNYKQDITSDVPEKIEQPSVTLQPDITPPNINAIKNLCYRYYDNTLKELGNNCTSNNRKKVEEYGIVDFFISGYDFSEVNVNGIKQIYYYFDNKPHTSVDKNATTQTPKLFRSNELTISDINKIQNPGVYYFSFFLQDYQGNLSNAYIYEYVYEPQVFKSIKEITFYKDKNQTQPLARYKVNVNPVNYGSNVPLWQQQSPLYAPLKCETKIKELTITWEYPSSYSEYVADSFNAWDPLISMSRDGKIISQNAYTISGLNNGNSIKYYKGVDIGSASKIGKYFEFYLKPLIGTALLEKKHKLLQITYNPYLETNLVCDKLTYYGEEVFKQTTATPGFIQSTLRGKILLQVEAHGEAWYVNPKDGKRYYMANGDKAYSAMRNFGIGITNNDLNKIKSDIILAKKSSGKIFLQVEAMGEAYYIDFNGIAHYLKNGASAYTIMRELGLGITNNDLSKIPEGSL
jgi:hypothetical protein